MRDTRSTDERAKRSGIKIEKNWVENGALGNSEAKRSDIKIEKIETLTTFKLVYDC